MCIQHKYYVNHALIKCILIFFLFPSHTDIQALDTLFINNKFNQATIKSFGYLYKEADPTKDLKYIKGISDNLFLPIEETGISFKAENYIHWVKCHIKNTDTTNVDLIIQFANPRLNQVQYFIEKGNGTIKESMLMGDDFPFEQREIKHRHYLFQLSLASSETNTIYIKSDKYGENIFLDLFLFNENIFWEKDGQGSSLLLIYIGFLFCILALTFLAGIISRKKILIYFFCYCFFAAFVLISWTGFGFQYIWGAFPFFNSSSGYLFIAFCAISVIGLTRTYLNMKSYAPKTELFLWVLQLVNVFYIPIIIGNKFIPDTILPIVTNLGNFIILTFASAVLFSPLIVYFKSKKKEHLLFLAGFLFAISGLFIHQLENLEIIENNWFSTHFMKIALLLDFFILIYLISRQIRSTYLENTQLSNSLYQTKIKAANALLTGQQEERNRLSMELHDGTSINLATLKMKLSNLKNNLSDEQQKTTVDDLINKLSHIAKNIRNFSHAFAPFDRNENSLEEAIADLIYDIESSNEDIRINCTYMIEENSLHPKMANHLFQTTKELLSNVLKHANASFIEVEFKKQNEYIFLIVKDNGKGLDPKKTNNGIGLKNIKARATLLDGNLDVQSSHHGTMVTFSFPI